MLYIQKRCSFALSSGNKSCSSVKITPGAHNKTSTSNSASVQSICGPGGLALVTFVCLFVCSFLNVSERINESNDRNKKVRRLSD